MSGWHVYMLESGIGKGRDWDGGKTFFFFICHHVYVNGKEYMFWYILIETMMTEAAERQRRMRHWCIHKTYTFCSEYNNMFMLLLILGGFCVIYVYLEVFMKFVQINLFVCFFRVICIWGSIKWTLIACRLICCRTVLVCFQWA